jgi:uroporphyrinogen-III synthase
MASLITRHGGVVIEAPSMREVPLSDQREALAVGAELMRGECDVLVLLTGVGTRMLVDVLATQYARDDLMAALRQTTLVCRGPKPVAVLKEWGIKPAVVAPAPNTFRDLLAALDEHTDVKGQRVLVQEYGVPNTELLTALRDRGAIVKAVPVYAWALPEDLGPLRLAIAAIAGGNVEAVVITSQQQVQHLFAVARELGVEESTRKSLKTRVLVASIGPVTSEALSADGIAVDIEPEHPKMGHLVLALARNGAEKLREKRGC